MFVSFEKVMLGVCMVSGIYVGGAFINGKYTVNTIEKALRYNGETPLRVDAARDDEEYKGGWEVLVTSLVRDNLEKLKVFIGESNDDTSPGYEKTIEKLMSKCGELLKKEFEGVVEKNDDYQRAKLFCSKINS